MKIDKLQSTNYNKHINFREMDYQPDKPRKPKCPVSYILEEETRGKRID